MTTQTLQDIIGKEPFHWRGDRDGLEEFNGAFMSLQGDDVQLTSAEMQEFEDFLATITLPPNPFREYDNQLSTSILLEGHFTSGRFAMAGQPLGSGNAVVGRELFNNQRLALLPNVPGIETSCSGCHSFPTGFGSNGIVRDRFIGTVIGGANLPTGPNGENHLHVNGMGTLGNLTMKVPQLRTVYEKVGLDLGSQESAVGFGFTHDGSVDTLSRFLSLEEFGPRSDQDVADLIAFLLSFSGSDLPDAEDQVQFPLAPPLSNDTHAAVGSQAMLMGSTIPGRVVQMLELADLAVVEVVAHAAGSDSQQGWLYQSDSSSFKPDDGSSSLNLTALSATASASAPVTLTVVPAGLGTRLALDRDGDGVLNRVERKQGSNPADAQSNSFSPVQGLWYNPARSGHGIDLQRAGALLAAIWASPKRVLLAHW